MDIYYSSKGGSGCSTTAAGVALLRAKRQATLLVDLAGEQEALLGQGTGSVGVWDWLAAADPPPDSLVRLEIRITNNLALLPAGSMDGAKADRLDLLASLLRDETRPVVIDVGDRAELLIGLASEVDREVLVTRACYLSAVKARRLGAPDTVVVIVEDGRSLRVSDIAAGVGALDSVELRWNAKVARAVDAGTTISQLPRLLSALAPLV